MFSSVLTFFAIFLSIFIYAPVIDTSDLVKGATGLAAAAGIDLPDIAKTAQNTVEQVTPEVAKVLQSIADLDSEFTVEGQAEQPPREGTQLTQGTQASAALDKTATTFTKQSALSATAEKIQEREKSLDRAESPKKCCGIGSIFGPRATE